MMDTTKATQAADMTLLLSLTTTVTGISVLAVMGIMIFMVACLVCYRTKSRRHKIDLRIHDAFSKWKIILQHNYYSLSLKSS